MQYKPIIILLVSLFTLIGCHKTNAVLIRIDNATGHDITEVFVQGPKDSHLYGDLKAGEASEYKLYEEAYRYAFCSFKIGDTEYLVQPIDFVGESLLPSGNYTYRLFISDLNTSWASMELIE